MKWSKCLGLNLRSSLANVLKYKYTKAKVEIRTPLKGGGISFASDWIFKVYVPLSMARERPTSKARMR